MIYKLSSICDIKVGYPFKSKFFNTSGDGVRLVRGMNISKNGFRWRNQTRWWNYLYDELSDYYLRENDVLIAMDGNVETNFAIVHSSDLPLLLVQRVARLRAKSFPQKLIWYIVKSPLFSAYIHSVKTGSTISHISANQIGEYSFELPDDMSRITRAVDILDAIDNQIYNNLVINDNLSKQAEAIFEGAFAESMYGDKKISDFILPKRGKPLLSKYAIAGDVPVVAGGLEPAAFHNVANTAAPVITISASGANAGFVRLWNIPVWSSDSSFIDKTMTDMVYFWYLVLKTRQDEIYGVQTGSAQPHVYPQNVGSLPINELDQVKAKEVNTLLTPLFEKIGENELENQKLASLRDSLLPRLLNGEINLAE